MFPFHLGASAQPQPASFPFVTNITDYGQLVLTGLALGCNNVASNRLVDCSDGAFSYRDVWKAMHIHFAGSNGRLRHLVCPLLKSIPQLYLSTLLLRQPGHSLRASEITDIWSCFTAGSVQELRFLKVGDNVLCH